MPTSRHSSQRGWGATDTAAAPPSLQPGRVDLIQQSHERCAALGLTRIERPDYAPLMRSDLNVARERNQRLFAHAAPVMEMLYEQIVNTESMLVLTDGKVSAVTRYDWAARIEKAAAAGTAPWVAIRSEIPVVDITGSAATVKIELWRDDVHTFTDYLSLYKFADGWKIVGKTFYRHPAPGTR